MIYDTTYKNALDLNSAFLGLSAFTAKHSHPLIQTLYARLPGFLKISHPDTDQMFKFQELVGWDVHKAIYMVNYMHMAQSHIFFRKKSLLCDHIDKCRALLGWSLSENGTNQSFIFFFSKIYLDMEKILKMWTSVGKLECLVTLNQEKPVHVRFVLLTVHKVKWFMNEKLNAA